MGKGEENAHTHITYKEKMRKSAKRFSSSFSIDKGEENLEKVHSSII